MHPLHTLQTLQTTIGRRAATRLLAPRDDRGDVPGWVMVTLMTAVIVTAISAIARPQLVGMVQQALSMVQ